MRKGLGQRLPVSLGAHRKLQRAENRRSIGARRCDRESKWDNQQQQAGKDFERCLPSDSIDQADAERREQELAEGAGGRAGAEGERAPAFRQQLAERRDHQVERAAGKSEADQHAAGEIKRARRGGMRHHENAGCIEQRPGNDHADSAEPIGDRPGKRCGSAVQEGLDRDREREHFAAPAICRRHRRKKETERRPGSEADHGDQAATNDDDRRCAPGFHAGAMVARAIGFSTIGRLITPESRPNRIESHQTAS